MISRASRPAGRARCVLLTVAVVGCAACASAAGPPREHGRFLPADLVEITSLEPTIKLDVRYATANNFLGRPVYREGRAFLQRPAAEALVRAHRALREKGYGLLVFDAYRPWSVTKLFWDLTPPSKRDFVANPRKGSKHNRGAAVDLSLFDLSTGREVEMPSAYDDFTDRARPDYQGGTPERRQSRDTLRAAMEREGFTVEPNEWWHFNWKDWRSYPILDIPLSALPRASRMDAASRHTALLEPSPREAERLALEKGVRGAERVASRITQRTASPQESLPERSAREAERLLVASRRVHPGATPSMTLKRGAERAASRNTALLERSAREAQRFRCGAREDSLRACALD
jgi:D-alanyl-D-alanine dipeptidase